MATVSQFTALARMEFAKATAEAQERTLPASFDQFTTTIGSSVKVETHTYMSSLPRLALFKGYSPSVRLEDKTYDIPNKTYRIGPVTIRKDDLDDDQTSGYLNQIKNLPVQGQKDVGHTALAFLAAGTSNLCFDGTAFFANSHTFGSGDNLDTANNASNDGVTHYMVVLRTDNSSVKPLLVQEREKLTELQTDADTPEALKQREYEYWADARLGFGYGHWWDAYHITITDTPTVAECYTMFEQAINGMRTFTLPKGEDSDSALYVHEGWEPNASNCVVLTNLKLGQIMKRAMAISQYVTSTGNVDNVYKDAATVIPTSALGA